VQQFNYQDVVARYNVQTKARSLVYTNEGQYDDFYTDTAGRLRLTNRTQAKNQVWFLRDAAEKSPFVEIARFPKHGYAETWEPLRFAADNKTFYLVSREEQDRGALYAYNTETKQRGSALFVPPEGEITDIVLSRDQTRLLGVVYLSDREHYHWFDPARAELQKTIDNTFPGSTCRVVSSSADEKIKLIYVSTDRDPGSFYILDLTKPALTLFKQIRPDVDPARMRPMETVNFTARDGLPLQAYLTRPAGDGKAPVPMVLYVHGGPFGIREEWGFDNEVQFLASRGYAVLQVNYRGSGGYGRAFIDKGARQWGRAMQDDLTDAVKWAVAQGVADPKRVAIYGASYGGYATLAGVTLTPELYCCGINYVGVANLEVAFKGYGGDANQMDGELDYQKTWVAPDSAYAAATSPLNLIEHIRVPTLHAYGENDARVEFKQWRELRAQLDKYHKPYTAIVEGEQGHGFRNESSSLKFHQAVEKFLAENLAPVRN
jgi:dipeptidyl aminopeptidase/acylaminoacyl peptidase